MYKEKMMELKQWLPVQKPLFYLSDFGIRFEIGDPKLDHLSSDYIDGAINRATVLYDDVFADSDTLTLIVNSMREAKDNEVALKQRIRNCIEVVEDVIEIEVIPYIYDTDDDEFVTVRYTIELNKSSIDKQKLIRGICYADFALDESIIDEVYIVDTRLRVAYHLYDDRGLDIVSDSPLKLRKLFTKRNEWLLDYDREEIEKQFKAVSDENVT